MLEFFTWLGGIWAKEVVKGASHALVDKLRSPELDLAIDGELKAWEKDVAADYAPGIQSGVLTHIFTSPLSSADISQSHMALRAYLEAPNVPPSEVWLNALMASWQRVKITAGPLQPFFEDDIRTVKPYLENLSQRLFKVCKQNETLFKGAVFSSLEVLHHKHDVLRDEILRILSDSRKEVDLTPAEHPVVFDVCPRVVGSRQSQSLSSGMDVVVTFEGEPSRRWRDPKPELIGIWNANLKSITSIEVPPAGWDPPPICVPSYRVDVEWRLPSHVRGDLWGPVKERVVRGFVTASVKKYILSRIMNLKRDEAVVLNCSAYDRYLSDQSAYYKGLEIALANHRFWKNRRILRMTNSDLRRVVDALVDSGELNDMVPDRFREKWNGRSVDTEAAFLVLNGLRKRENALLFKASSRAPRPVARVAGRASAEP